MHPKPCSQRPPSNFQKKLYWNKHCGHRHVIDKIISELDMLDPNPLSSEAPTVEPPSETLSSSIDLLSFFEIAANQGVDDNRRLLAQYFAEDDVSRSLLFKPRYAKIINYNTQLLASASCEPFFPSSKMSSLMLAQVFSIKTLKNLLSWIRA